MTARQFSDIYTPLSDNLYRVAYYLLESQADAEDAVQDLYIKLWNSRDTLDAVRNPGAYCITLMKNLCIDRIRKTSRRVTAELKDDVSADGSADDTVIYKEQLERVRKAMERLPRSQRTVLEMKTMQGLSYEEIQEKTGLGYTSLRVLLSNARKAIKRQL
ncbi:MAG: RNA polymerase sigma factor [Bacteroidia bacterium]|nr:RNA polymerase sigma factor [Bacteroidia bacterium]